MPLHITFLLFLSPHSTKVQGLNPPAGWGLSLWSLHVRPAPARFLPESKERHFRLTGDFKLDIGVNVSGNSSLSLCVNP